MDDSNLRGDSEGLSWISAESSRLVSRQVRADQHYCSIEYVDHEGEKVIYHVFLSVDEQIKFIEQCVRSGIKAKVYDLQPPAVSSVDE